MTYAELRSALLANKHQHALEGVGKVRFHMLESQLTQARQARKDAEKQLHDYLCTENDALNAVRAENRRLQRELDALTRALSLAAQSPVQPAQAVEPNPPRRSWPNRSRGLPRKSTGIRDSELVKRALRGEPLPEPPEPGTFDPTIGEEEL